MKKIWRAILRFFEKLFNVGELKEYSKPEENRQEWHDLERDILYKINMARLYVGLDSLQGNKDCWRTARLRLEYQVEQPKITHDNIAMVIYPLNELGYKSVSEILGYGYAGAQTVFEAWMTSNGHKSVILKRDYKYAGVAHKRHNNKNYWCVVFAK